MTWVNTWSIDQIEDLLHKRDVECKPWKLIAIETGRPLASCFRVWKLNHLDAVVEAPEPEKLPSLYEELGIQTHVHRQAILNDPRFREWDDVNRVWNHSHLFRESITLPGAS